MTTIVSHYGVHRTAEGVVYLHQGGAPMNFIRLSEPSPFEIRIPKGKEGVCPHAINGSAPTPDLEQWQRFVEIFKDELLQYFLPVPRHQLESIPFISDCDDMLLMLLSKLSSPVAPVVHRFNRFRYKGQLEITNIGPLVLTHLKPENQMALEELVSLARRSPRRLILHGDENMVIREPMKRVYTSLNYYPQSELYTLPMENLGAVALRRWARGEQMDGPWIRK